MSATVSHAARAPLAMLRKPIPWRVAGLGALLAGSITLVARLAYLDRLPDRAVGPDEAAILTAAARLWTGQGLSLWDGSPLKTAPPLNAIILAPFTAGGDPELAGPRSFVILGVLGALLGALAAALLWNSLAGSILAGSAVGTSHWFLVVPLAYGSLTETVAIPMVMGFLALAAVLVRTPRWWLAFLAGGAGALAFQVRVEGAALMLVAVLLAAGLGWRQGGWRAGAAWGAVAAGGAVLASLPFLVRVWMITGTLALTTVDNCTAYAYRAADALGRLDRNLPLVEECRAAGQQSGLAFLLRYVLDPDVLQATVPMNGRIYGQATANVMQPAGMVALAAVSVLALALRRWVLVFLVLGAAVLPILLIVVAAHYDFRYLQPATAVVGWFVAGGIGAMAGLGGRWILARLGRPDLPWWLAGLGLVPVLVAAVVFAGQAVGSALENDLVRSHPGLGLKRAALWLRDQEVRGPVVTSNTSVITFYSGLPPGGFRSAASIDEAVARAQAVCAAWMVLSLNEGQFVPAVEPLRQGRAEHPALTRSFTTGSIYGPVVVFAVERPPGCPSS